MYLRCKEDLQHWKFDLTLSGGYRLLISGSFYQVKQIVNLKDEMIYVIDIERGFTENFKHLININPTTSLSNCFLLTDYFYLPEEWREIQLQKLFEE